MGLQAVPQRRIVEHVERATPKGQARKPRKGANNEELLFYRGTEDHHVHRRRAHPPDSRRSTARRGRSSQICRRNSSTNITALLSEPPATLVRRWKLINMSWQCLTQLPNGSITTASIAGSFLFLISSWKLTPAPIKKPEAPSIRALPKSKLGTTEPVTALSNLSNQGRGNSCWDLRKRANLSTSKSRRAERFIFTCSPQSIKKGRGLCPSFFSSFSIDNNIPFML